MLMKDGLGRSAIERIGIALARLIPEFNGACFRREAMAGLDAMELRERVDHLIVVLHGVLPKKFSDCASVLMKLPQVWDYGDPNDALRGFAAWPLTDYVSVYGIKAPKNSLRVLEKLTPLFSAEFAIRPFIEQHESFTFEFLQKWLVHPNEHVRRLVSEGTRPRLPWGKRLNKFIENPAPIIPLLAALRLDSSQYVVRSVANSLNDIAKDHPDLVIDICRQWQAKDKGKSDWLISHATRSLVKSGHPKSFALLGYTSNPAVTITNLRVDKKTLAMGDSLGFSFDCLAEKSKQKCVVDYAVHYLKANGRHAAKVFKLKNVSLDEGERIKLVKQLSFKKISTRKYYPGEHFLAVHVNGVEQAKISFTLTQ